MKISKQRLKEIIREELKKVQESTVQVSNDIDADFRGNMVQLIGRKGKVPLSKKDLLALIRLVQKHMGRAYTEGKLTEGGAWTTSQTKSVDKIDGAFKKLLAKKGIEPYSYEASKLWKRAGFDKKMRDIFGKDESIGEGKLREAIRRIIREDFAGAYPEHQRKQFDNKRRKQSEVLGYKLTGVDDVKTEIDDATVKEVFKRLGQKLKEHAAGGLTYKKGKTVMVTHKTSGKELVIIDKPNVRKEYEKIGYVAEGKLTEKKESAIDVAKRIVKDKQYEQGVDMQTANLILKIYQAYDKHPALQKKFEKMPLKKMAQNVWRFVK